MMAVAHPKLGLRPFLPDDAPILREIFRDSIEELTADDYTAAQQEAWASVADDVADISPGDQVACAGSQCAFHAEQTAVPRSLAVAIPPGGA